MQLSLHGRLVWSQWERIHLIWQKLDVLGGLGGDTPGGLYPLRGEGEGKGLCEELGGGTAAAFQM